MHIPKQANRPQYSLSNKIHTGLKVYFKDHKSNLILNSKNGLKIQNWIKIQYFNNEGKSQNTFRIKILFYPDCEIRTCWIVLFQVSALCCHFTTLCPLFNDYLLFPFVACRRFFSVYRQRHSLWPLLVASAPASSFSSIGFLSSHCCISLQILTNTARK